MQEQQAAQCTDGGFQAHQHAEGTRRQFRQRHHLQAVGQRGGQQRHAERDGQQRRREQRGARMRHAERHGDQCGDGGAQGDGLRSVVVAGLLPEHDIQRPARTRAERIGCTNGIQCLRALLRYQQHQPQHGQCDPDNVAQVARAEQRHRQRTGELQRDGDAQRHRFQRLVEHQVHQAQRDAVRQQRGPLVPLDTHAPRAEHRDQQQRRQGQA